MVIIGITGLIASGKTEVCKILQKNYKIPVIYTDRLAKYIYKTDALIFSDIIRLFGEKIISNEQINYELLGEIVFSSPIELRKLERIIHPAIIRLQGKIIKFFKRAKKNKKILAIESALLVKLSQHKLCDYIIYVKAPEKIRNARLSNNMQEREKYQSNYDKIEFDFIISNDGTFNQLEEKVEKIMNIIIETYLY